MNNLPTYEDFINEEVINEAAKLRPSSEIKKELDDAKKDHENMANLAKQNFIKHSKIWKDYVQNFFNTYLSDISGFKPSMDKITINNPTIYFGDSKNYDKFSIYISSPMIWREEDFDSYKLPEKDVQLSFYTTTTTAENKEELNRVVGLGKVAKVLLDSKAKNDLIDNFSKIYIDFLKDGKEIDEYSLRSKVSDLEKELKSSLTEEMLKSGAIYKFDTPKKFQYGRNRYDSLDVEYIEILKVKPKMVQVKLIPIKGGDGNRISRTQNLNRLELSYLLNDEKFPVTEFKGKIDGAIY